MIVYLSHSAAQNVAPLRRLLEQEGVDLQGSFDFSARGDMTDAAQSAIKKATAFIAVLDSSAVNVYFEIGIATALRKPVLILLGPGMTAPAFISGVRHLVSGVTDSDILRLGVKSFLREARTRRHAKAPTSRSGLLSTGRPNHGRIQTIIEELKEGRASLAASAIEHVAAELLRAAAITAIEEQSPGKDRGIDFAIWSDSLHASRGNPILVEVKAGSLDNAKFAHAYDQLVSSVFKAEARAGLLLYMDRNGRRFSKPDKWVASVLTFDLEDFARELLTKSFAETIVERRNRAVHGLSE
jgi:hypothetical protein